MSFILTAAGVVLTFTLLRLMGNEREHAQRRRDAELARQAAEAAELEAQAALAELMAPPAAKGQAAMGAVVQSKPVAQMNPPAAKKAA